MYDIKKLGQNMSFRRDINPEKVLLFLFQLDGFIQYKKIDQKDILDITKLVKKYIQSLLM